MIPHVNSSENDNKSREDNIQDIIPGTLHTYLLRDHQIIRNAV